MHMPYRMKPMIQRRFTLLYILTFAHNSRLHAMIYLLKPTLMMRCMFPDPLPSLLLP